MSGYAQNAPDVPLETVFRIDFIRTAQGWRISKLVKRRLEGRGNPAPAIINVVSESEIKPEPFDLDGALSWCESHGWTVRRWGGSEISGARAFRFGLEPIRSTREIQRMRQELKQYPRPELGNQTYALDLAYDL
jgi:hypothetical protein